MIQLGLIGYPVNHSLSPKIQKVALDACGVEIPETVDGKSVLGQMRGEETPWREFVHGEHTASYSPDNAMQYLTDGNWKYIWYTRTGQEQLFDLQNDRYETENLAAQEAHAATLEQWREKLIGVLEPRQAGLVENGELVCQKDKSPLISPHYAERVERMRKKMGIES